ncbi:substrate-binding periplasmic protein [Massilia sp. TSP1-1-2]|uniref:substrate-binding periplasmic protein n=1 Tax=unclassified Massilia TaxID=2609279 RepID=UPI003CE9718B
MFKHIVCILAALAAAGTATAGNDQLRMIAPLNHAMPLASFKSDKLSGGILKDLGEAIARRLGRSIIFISVAGDQVGAALSDGKADGVCYVRPFWIDGDFDWSAPLLPDTEVVASHPDMPVLRSLLDLRDRPVGTVTGYRYPRVEQVLGLRFLRSDSPTMEENLHKLMLGHARYTVIVQSTLAYHAKMNKSLKLRPDLTVASFSAQCAFSRRSHLPFADVDKAINGLIADGSVQRILARYR